MKYALLGYGIDYSLSPLIHTSVTPAMEYRLLDMSPEALSRDLQKMIGDLDGFNVTIPHKQAVMPFCDRIDDLALKIGAVNTVKISSDGLTGYNTDHRGFALALRDQLPGCDSLIPVVLGYGGAARAILIALEEMGFSRVCVTGGFDAGERQAFVEEISPVLSLEICSELPEERRLWINCTPLGSDRHPEIPEDFISFRAEDQFFDLNYMPRKTHLQILADKAGIAHANGIHMLILQAVAAQRIWLDDPALTVDMNTMIKKCYNTGS